jgi:hypothetical protein
MQIRPMLPTEIAAAHEVAGGPIFTRGELGTLAPYLPSGAYL